MTDLGTRLAELGDVLDVDDRNVVEVVLRRVQAPRGRASRPRRLVVMATAAVVVVLAGALVHPGSRDALARWFGLDGVRIVRTDVDPPQGRPSIELPGPGGSEVVVVNGREILVSTIDGRVDGLISKNVGPGTSIIEVAVDGRPGLWIDGAPHEVLYEAPGGSVVIERVAGNTLLWQDGDMLHRVEGFDHLHAALAFATSGT
jgi:hypothetical protein